MTALLDTGFLLAVISPDDRLHRACADALDNEPDPLLPAAILTELAYMILRDAGHVAFIRFMRSVFNGELSLVFADESDLIRATDIMEKYADARIDFVDCVIAAMAERLHITRILTVDQRHFRLLRPSHTPAFDILP
jgi:predicted nucleic acid-binding protein